MRDDPRPIIAARLDTPFTVRLLCMDPVFAKRLLDDEIPEGKPWIVDAPADQWLNSPLHIRHPAQWIIKACIPDEWYGAEVGVPNSPERCAEIKAAREASEQ